MTDNTICGFLILNTLLFGCNLAFTIGGSIILDNNNSLSASDNKFFNVWLSNLILTVVSGISSFALLVTCCGLTQLNEEKKTSTNQIVEIIGLGVSIWTLVIYFSGNTDLDLLESDYYNLFMLLKIRVFYSIALFSLVGLILALAILSCVCGGAWFLLCDKEEATDEIMSNSIKQDLSNPYHENNGNPVTNHGHQRTIV